MPYVTVFVTKVSDTAGLLRLPFAVIRNVALAFSIYPRSDKRQYSCHPIIQCEIYPNKR